MLPNKLCALIMNAAYFNCAQLFRQLMHFIVKYLLLLSLLLIHFYALLNYLSSIL